VEQLTKNVQKIQALGEVVARTLQTGGKLIFMGNGGSADKNYSS